MKRFSLLLTVVAACAFCPTVEAEVFHLQDGTTITGAHVVDIDDRVIVLLPNGKLEEIPRKELLLVETARNVDPELTAKARKEKKRLLKKRRKAAAKLLTRYGKTDDGDTGASERREIELELDGYSGEELAPGLADGICSKRRRLRELSFRRLVAIGGGTALVPLARGALNAPDESLRKRSHDAVLAISEDAGRRVYEYVVAGSQNEGERLRSLAYVDSIGSLDSVPGLIRILEYVDATVRFQLVRDKGLKQVPVSLGSLGAAATQVPIDLPNTELIQVQVSTRVPTKSAKIVRQGVAATLTSITGEKHGEDVEAWKEWWAWKKATSKKPVKETDAAPERHPPGGTRRL